MFSNDYDCTPLKDLNYIFGPDNIIMSLFCYISEYNVHLET